VQLPTLSLRNLELRFERVVACWTFT
jgi:hypothetical protein